MNRKFSALLALAALLFATLACNLPGQGAGGVSTLPASDQTLTALFAVTPVSSATPTLPPIVTATQAGGAAKPTATTGASGNNNPTATTKPTTAANPSATKTSAPAATATVPSTRTRTQVVAKYIDKALTIDGDWGEWKDLTTEYPMNNVVWGKQNWSNADDLSGSFHVGWDNTYLYIAAKIHDDKYVQNATGENIYLGDGLEVLLDTNLQGDYYYNKLSPDDFQLGIAPGRPDPAAGNREAYLWFPSNLAHSRSDVKIGSILEDGVYRVEAAIPWSLFEITPTNGGHYGFALSANDNDDPNHNLQQSMISNVAGRVLADPTTWGDLQLTK